MGFADWLSAKVVKMFDSDLQEEELLREEVRKDFNYALFAGGCYLPHDPKYVILSLGYNFFLPFLFLFHIIQSVATHATKDLDLERFSLLLNIAVIAVMSLVTHVTLFVHRSNFTSMYRDFASCALIIPRPPDLVFLATKKAFVIGLPSFLIFCASALLFIGPLVDKGRLDVKSIIPVDLGLPDTELGDLLFLLYSIVLSTGVIVVVTAGLSGYVLLGLKIVSELKLAIKTIKTLAESSDDQQYHTRLGVIVHHHNYLIEAFKQFRTTGMPSVLGTIMLSAIMIAMSLHCIISDTGIGLKISSLGILLNQLLIVWMVCFFGQEISRLCDELREELYFTRWYQRPEASCKVIRIIQIVALKPLLISQFGFTADYNTFTSVMNSAYSYMSLMYALKK